MTERPIPFDDATVRAILAGHKSQIRRVIKNIPWRGGCNPNFSQASAFSNAGEFRIAGSQEMTTGFRCPFGRPGDRLWVREKWAPRTLGRWGVLDKHMLPLYRASEDRPEWEGIWRRSVHMPRWACRLVLEITDVRVERLHQISHRDAIKEGARRIDVPAGYDQKYSTDPVAWADIVEGRADAYNDPRHAFRDLWTSTVGDWDTNPWVWVIEFKRIAD